MDQKKLYRALMAFCLLLIVFGFCISSPSDIFRGIAKIYASNDMLITDYMEIACPGAAFVNSGTVTLLGIILLRLLKTPCEGYTVSVVALMAGFSLFGKNTLNSAPIIFGAFLYSRARREPFVEYVRISFLATTLGPLVSSIFLRDPSNPLVIAGGILIGIFIGFVLVPVSKASFHYHRGMNIYNMGFAAGLLAMVIVPVLISFGLEFESVDYWFTGKNVLLASFIYGLCLLLIILALVLGKGSCKSYFMLLKTSGRSSSDYVKMFGLAPSALNCGINGILVTTVLLVVGGDLNGPTIGGIFTVMGFSFHGEHVRNLSPVIAGVIIGGLIKQWSLTDHSAQLALLFCSSLAPISGYFGWYFGIIAGFLHSSVTLRAGLPLAGLNLYNNGFSAGLVALVMYPVINALLPNRDHPGPRRERALGFKQEEPQSK
ncbi:MAG: DUF1576 domain-containing protein [Oscillospiraceae bacterium]|nr:DUF1576 domain-containing protein [Oscillospiraceae bacterium]